MPMTGTVCAFLAAAFHDLREDPHAVEAVHRVLRSLSKIEWFIQYTRNYQTSLQSLLCQGLGNAGRRHMFTLRKSMVLGAAFFAGVAIAAHADPLCRTPTGLCRPPDPEIAALPYANVALAPGGVTLPKVNVFGRQPPGE
jgi:hypothetical protein